MLRPKVILVTAVALGLPTLLAEAQARPTSASAPTTASAKSLDERIECDLVTEDSERTFEIRAGTHDVVARCVGHCHLVLSRGIYGFYAPASGSKPELSKDFAVSSPSRITFGERSPTLEQAGVVLKTAGFVLLGAGVLLLGSAACINECADSTARTTRAQLGLAGLVTGVILIPVGLGLRSKAAEVPVYEALASRIRVGYDRRGNAGLLALSWSF